MKRIQLTVARLLAEDKKFYHNMLKVRLRKSRRAERAIGRTLTKLILEESDYTAPNPLDSAPEIGIDERLVELFNTQVYEKIKSNADFNEIDLGMGAREEFVAKITLDRDANPELYDCYEAFSKLVWYTVEQDRKIAGIGERIAETGVEIERTRNSLPMLEKERDDLDARLKAKRGKRKPKINGLSTDLDGKKAAIQQIGRTEKRLRDNQKELYSEKENAEDERKCCQRYFLSTVASSAASAGLGELEAAARKMAGNGNKSSVSRDLIARLDERFTESVTQNMVCGIDFPEKVPFILSRLDKIVGGVLAAGGAAVLAAALGLFGGTKGTAEQAMADYNLFKRGNMTVAELEERHPAGTEGYSAIRKSLIKDGYIKSGKIERPKSEKITDIFAEQGTPMAERPRDITVVDNPADLNREFRRYARRGREEEITVEEDWQASGMKRDGTKWKPVRKPEKPIELAKAVTGVEGVESFRYGAGTYSLNLGNQNYIVKGENKGSKIIVSCKNDMAGDDVKATLLELMVDEGGNRITPILPKDMEEGKYLFFVYMEDAAGNHSQCTYLGDVKRDEDNDTLYFGMIGLLARQSTESWIDNNPMPENPYQLEALVKQFPNPASVEWKYKPAYVMADTWSRIPLVHDPKDGSVNKRRPQLPKMAPPGEYIVKATTNVPVKQEKVFRVKLERGGTVSSTVPVNH